MEFEEVLKRLQEDSKEEFGNSRYTLFNNGNILYYRLKGQSQEDAIKDNQRPHILSENWWNDDWQFVKEKVEEPKKSVFEDELREAYDNNCFGDILDVIQGRLKRFIDYSFELHKKSEIDKLAKIEFGERLI